MNSKLEVKSINRKHFVSEASRNERPVSQTVSQKSNCSRSRASSISGDSLYMPGIVQPLFKRWCFKHGEIPIWKHVFLNCNFQTLFMVRSVSQLFCHLASRAVALNQHKLLPSKMNLGMNIDTSINELLNSSCSINSINDNNEKFILKVQNIEELIQLLRLVKDNKNIIYRIIELDLGGIVFNYLTCNLINELFARDFPELTKLTIGCIAVLGKVILPKVMQKLKTLTIGPMFLCTEVKFPHSVDNLTTLIFEGIGDTLKLILPASLSNITTLTVVEKIGVQSILKVSNEFQNLRIVTVGRMPYGSTLILPKAVEKLIIGTLFIQAAFHLQDGSRLRTLILGDIHFDVECRLPDAISKIKALTIGNVYQGATIEFPKDLNELKLLTIGETQQNTKLKFPTALNNLESLTMGNMNSNSLCDLPVALPRLTRFVMGDIMDDGYFGLPTFLDNLITLEIGNIASGAYLKLHHAPSLMNLKLGNVDANAFIELPNLLHGLINIEFGTIIDDDTFIMLKRLSLLCNQNRAKYGIINEGNADKCCCQ